MVGSCSDRLHLRETSIDKQFRSRDVATVVGRKKHHRLGDLPGCAEPAERNTGGDHLQALLACLRGSEQPAQAGRIGGARAHCVDTNAALLQVRRPGAAAANSGSRRPVMKTYAPSVTNSLAVARPMPLLPPVTSAILPSSLPMYVFLGCHWLVL